jgi:protein-tyrosine phosphatase
MTPQPTCGGACYFDGVTRIVTICTGNICRSPAAELLFARALGPDAVVTSAGTHALVGHGIPTEMLMCLDGDELDGRPHRSQQYTEDLARSADLVIAMASEHRTWALQAAPFAMRRTFMLTEISEAARRRVPLAGANFAERLANVPDAVNALRPELAGARLADVPDPYGLSLDVYADSYNMIRGLVDEIAEWVRG